MKPLKTVVKNYEKIDRIVSKSFEEKNILSEKKKAIYKLYPYEWMAEEDFAKYFEIPW